MPGCRKLPRRPSASAGGRLVDLEALSDRDATARAVDGSDRARFEAALMGSGGMEYGVALYRRAGAQARIARAVDERKVRNSGGGVERRYIIETPLRLGDRVWPIELALANRDQMGFRMLLGRTALDGRALIEPGRSFLVGHHPPRLRQWLAWIGVEPRKALP